MDAIKIMDSCAFDILFKKSVPHILEKIFFSLDYESFKTCMKVSNSWNELLTSESWKGIGKSTFHKDIGRELSLACGRDNINKVKRIISSGMADVNFGWGSCGMTPLIFASRYNHKDVVQILLDNGADPDKAVENGWTPLHLAADRGHRDVVEVLLNGGVEPNQTNNERVTPLHVAAGKGHKSVVQLLLARGADVNATVRGKTSLDLAAQGGHTDVVHILQGRDA